MLRRKEGFTLIELLIVILIIAILVAIALPLYLRSQTNAKKRTCQANLRTVDGQINAYKAEFENQDPANVAELVNSGFLKKTPLCPEGGVAYTLWEPQSGRLEASCMTTTAHTL